MSFEPFLPSRDLAGAAGVAEAAAVAGEANTPSRGWCVRAWAQSLAV